MQSIDPSQQSSTLPRHTPFSQHALPRVDPAMTHTFQSTCTTRGGPCHDTHLSVNMHYPGWTLPRNTPLSQHALPQVDLGLMKSLHLLPCNLKILSLNSTFPLISSLVSLCSLVLCYNCLSALLAYSPAFLPKPTSASTITRRQKVTTITVAQRSHVQKSHQYGDPKGMKKIKNQYAL